MILLVALNLLFITISSNAQPESAPPYKDPRLSVSERVEDLLGRMTSEEKFFQLFMVPGDLSTGKEKPVNGLFGLQVPGRDEHLTAKKLNEIQHFFMEETRLGIPAVFFEEALHGLALEGTTIYPQSIGLAATFDATLMNEIARSVAKECRARGIRQVLSPVVNLATDVRWGRTEETFGEDPFLASEMGFAFVSGFEDNGVIATPKHFIANVGDGGRDSYPIMLSEMGLRITHLPPFEACIKRGKARSVMSAYNTLDGIPCSANRWLLETVLKDEMGFNGFVVSDAGAVGGANVLHFTATDYADATAKSINGGLDVILQTSFDQYPLFNEAFRKGMIPGERIDDAVRRVLRAKFELGLFDEPYVPSSMVTGTKEAHRSLALKAARESIVLLKNEHEVLPLKKGLRRIAVIGPDALDARMGGYSGRSTNVVSILEGIRQEVGPSMEVVYARGCERVIKEFIPVPGNVLFHNENGHEEPGLKGEYYDNAGWIGKPVLTRTDSQVKFQWTLFGPDPNSLPYDFFSVRWTGHLVAPESGTFRIGVDGNDGYRLWLGGRVLIDRTVPRTRQVSTVPVVLEQGKAYELRIEYSEPRGNAWFSLVWDAGMVKDHTPDLSEAVELARQSDAMILVAGIEEGEFRDRSSLALPGNQEELINLLAATGKPLIIILVGGSAITMSTWIDRADAILDAWYPGEAGGIAVADILFGKYSPAGRLPVSFPVHEGQLPLVYNHLPTGRGDDYTDLTGRPLFPFGFGLSYTSFLYSNLVIDKESLGPGDIAEVRFNLTNSGTFDGDEVVQLYIHGQVSTIARPVAELKAFRRISLKKGESGEIRFTISTDMLQWLDKDLKKTVEPGKYIIMIGSSSKDIRLKGILKVTD